MTEFVVRFCRGWLRIRAGPFRDFADCFAAMVLSCDHAVYEHEMGYPVGSGVVFITATGLPVADSERALRRLQAAGLAVTSRSDGCWICSSAGKAQGLATVRSDGKAIPATLGRTWHSLVTARLQGRRRWTNRSSRILPGRQR
jgi:hypothetical protein